MSDKHCPTEVDLLRFVDLDLPPEKLELIEAHCRQCSLCARQVAALRELLADVAAPPPELPFDVAQHVQGVMMRLDSAPKASGFMQRAAARWATLGGACAAAAAVCVVVFTHDPNPETHGEFAARGGPLESSLSREIGLQLYTQTTQTQPLSAGAKVAASQPLTAGLRNLGESEVYLLLFAVDAKHDVHWIAPQYTVAGTNPEAARVAPGSSEKLLPSAAVFDDVGVGPLRVVALITRELTHVAKVEQLPPADLSVEALRVRFPGAEVRQFILEVTP